MLERLAGRLQWERTGSGIRVEIPAQKGWLTVFLAVWLVIWSGAGLFGSIRVSTGDDVNIGQLIFAVIWALAEVGVVIAMIWSLTGRTILTVNQSEVSLQRRILGVEWDMRRFATQSVRNLRYIPSTSVRGWDGSQLTNTQTLSQIKFEADGKSRVFASGISDIEAFALIDRMLEVYNFPRDRALEYIGKP